MFGLADSLESAKAGVFRSFRLLPQGSQKSIEPRCRRENSILQGALEEKKKKTKRKDGSRSDTQPSKLLTLRCTGRQPKKSPSFERSRNQDDSVSIVS